MRRLRARLGPSDSGTSLAEVLVAMLLVSVLGTLLVTAFANAGRLFRVSDAEASGQTDVRLTIERLGRDVRAARSIAAGATGSQLELWIDADSDYIEEAAEIVTWTLAASGDHYDVTRVENGVSRRQSRFVISEFAFCYKTASIEPCMTVGAGGLTADQARTTRVVYTDVEYDPNVDSGTSSRHATFEERLRNVG